MTIPNCLTLLRLFVSPVFLLIYREHESLGISSIALPFVLLALLFVLELSDVADGYLARKLNQVTDLGKVLDPMADSIARICVLLTFTQKPVELPLELVFVFLYRDSIISTLRTVCAFRGFALAARPSGKFKVVLQAVAAFTIVLLMIPHAQGDLSTSLLQEISAWVVGAVAGYAVLSAADYFYANWDYVVRLISPTKAPQ